MFYRIDPNLRGCVCEWAAPCPTLLSQYRYGRSWMPPELKVSTLNLKPLFSFHIRSSGLEAKQWKHITAFIFPDFCLSAFTVSISTSCCRVFLHDLPLLWRLSIIHTSLQRTRSETTARLQTPSRPRMWYNGSIKSLQMSCSPCEKRRCVALRISWASDQI